MPSFTASATSTAMGPLAPSSSWPEPTGRTLADGPASSALLPLASPSLALRHSALARWSGPAAAAALALCALVPLPAGRCGARSVPPLHHPDGGVTPQGTH